MPYSKDNRHHVPSQQELLYTGLDYPMPMVPDPSDYMFNQNALYYQSSEY